MLKTYILAILDSIVSGLCDHWSLEKRKKTSPLWPPTTFSSPQLRLLWNNILSDSQTAICMWQLPSLVQKTQPKLSLKLDVHIIRPQPLHRIELGIPQTSPPTSEKILNYNPKKILKKIQKVTWWNWTSLKNGKKDEGEGKAQEEDGQVVCVHLPIGE